MEFQNSANPISGISFEDAVSITSSIANDSQETDFGAHQSKVHEAVTKHGWKPSRSFKSGPNKEMTHVFSHPEHRGHEIWASHRSNIHPETGFHGWQHQGPDSTSNVPADHLDHSKTSTENLHHYLTGFHNNYRGGR